MEYFRKYDTLQCLGTEYFECAKNDLILTTSDVCRHCSADESETRREFNRLLSTRRANAVVKVKGNNYTVRAGVLTASQYLPTQPRVNRRNVFETAHNQWDEWYDLNRWPSVCFQCGRDSSYFYLQRNTDHMLCGACQREKPGMDRFPGRGP
jgi:hypothetical protein